MRKRYIKSVAHWVIMSIVLLFPILMVGISSFAQKQQEINVTETYEYETNEVNSIDDLVVGNIYKFTIDLRNYSDASNTGFLHTTFVKFNYDNLTFSYNNEQFLLMYYGQSQYIRCYNNYSDIDARVYFIEPNIIDLYVVYNDINHNTITYQNFSASDYLGEKTIDYTITDQTMRDDVNEWCSSFRNLPVNQWYGEMLDTIGLGITDSMMMNVIYTYPLYVLWVYIIDLLVDCLLVIINFGHNALKRLGADNE